MSRWPTVITDLEAIAIHEDRRSYRDIGVAYGVSAMTVSNIKAGKTWKHLGLKPTTRGRNHKSIPRTREDEHNANS